jgi:hypothetical protein
MSLFIKLYLMSVSALIPVIQAEIVNKTEVSSAVTARMLEETSEFIGDEYCKNKNFKRFKSRLEKLDDSGDFFVYRSVMKEDPEHLISESINKNSSDSEFVPPAPLLRVKILGNEHLALLDGGTSHCFISNKVAKQSRALGFKVRHVDLPTSTSNGKAGVTEAIKLHVAWTYGGCEMNFYILP